MWNAVVKIVLRKSWEMGWHEGYERGWKDCEEQAVKAIVNESEWIKAVKTGEPYFLRVGAKEKTK